MGILSSKRGMAMRYGTYLAVFAATGYAFGQNGAMQPRVTGQRSLPNSTILRGEEHAATMQRLRVVRQYGISDVRSNPQVMLGEMKLDFGPMLNNPKASFNIAQRLRAMPQNVEVREDESDISEIDQGRGS